MVGLTLGVASLVAPRSSIPIRKSARFRGGIPRTCIDIPPNASADVTGASNISLSSGSAGEVNAAEGVRVRCEASFARLEYLLSFVDIDDFFWVPSDVVADDIKRNYEAKWWQTCREGNIEAVEKMLRGGGQALVAARDADDRSGLHYACGVGNEECVRAILAYGAEVDSLDKDSFTPLHIAAGYLHEKIVEVLVQAGANPELEDSTGRSPLDIVETLKLNTPATTVTYGRRSTMESLAQTLERFVFEEVPPSSIKQSRLTEDNLKEYLIEWLDDCPDSWILEENIAEDLLQDYAEGMEYAQLRDTFVIPPGFSDSTVRNVRLNTWADNAPPSWDLS